MEMVIILWDTEEKSKEFSRHLDIVGSEGDLKYIGETDL